MGYTVGYRIGGALILIAQDFPNLKKLPVREDGPVTCPSLFDGRVEELFLALAAKEKAAQERILTSVPWGTHCNSFSMLQRSGLLL